MALVFRAMAGVGAVVEGADGEEADVRVPVHIRIDLAAASWAEAAPAELS
jgi:hypothetical protein